MLEYLGLDDWTIIENNDPWCNEGQKILYIYKNDSQCLLHEATHSLIGGGHKEHFWTLFEAMVDFFLGTGLNDMQAQMKKDYLSK